MGVVQGQVLQLTLKQMQKLTTKSTKQTKKLFIIITKQEDGLKLTLRQMQPSKVQNKQKWCA